jgi:hypothetical protein
MAFTYLRPDADDTDGSWVDSSGGTSLFDKIDETSLDDADYIRSALDPVHDICKIRLSDPGGSVSEPAKVRYRYRKRGDARTDLTVTLLQGATPIAVWSNSNIGTTFTTAEQTLTTPQFTAISDFTNLFLQFDAYGVAFPLNGSALDLWFETGQYDNGGAIAITDVLSVSRASVGYAKTAAGTLTSFLSNTLRITDAGLLIEDARTNGLVKSQELDDIGYWPTNNVTATADQANAPDGTLTADKILVTGTNDCYIRQHGIDTATTTVYTLSVYAKVGFGSAIIAIGWVTSPHILRRWFDLSSGTILPTIETGGNIVSDGAAIEALGNGWYRCSISGHEVTTSSNLYYSAFHPCVSADGSITTTANDFIYLWGAQEEEGVFPSSYIPTTTAAATRAADNITIIGSAQTLIAAAASSIVVQTGMSEGTGFSANTVDSNGTNVLGFDSTNHTLASMIGTLATSNTANRSAVDDKSGIAWSGAGRSLVLNNGTVATDANAQTPSSTQNLGSASGTSHFIYAYIKRLTIWTTKLADATLKAFTA